MDSFNNLAVSLNMSEKKTESSFYGIKRNKASH